MGFFSNLFGKNETTEVSKINWINLNKESQLDEIQEVSNTKPVLIFKHSTRCHISKTVLKQFENEFNLQEKIDCYFLDLLENREISNEIVKRFRVIHQSPQLILIKNGMAVYNTSHENIDARELENII